MVPGAASVGLVAPARERKPGDHALALGDDRDQGAGAHVLDQPGVEGLALVLGVVGGQLLRRGGALGQGDDFVALRLEPTDDLPTQSALDGIGLEQDKCSLCGHGTRVPRRQRRKRARRCPGLNPRPDVPLPELPHPGVDASFSRSS